MERQLHLDCESRQSALQSLARLYATDASALTEFMLGFDMDAHYSAHEHADSGEYVIHEVLDECFGEAARPSSVSWFHLTRIPPQADFSAGILPLNEALDGIWAALEHVTHDSVQARRLRDMRSSGVPNWLYNLKLADRVHRGPFAMLVKEAAYRASEMSNHDYLGIPEIVQDICRAYTDRYAEDLESLVRSCYRPCIVKFSAGAPRHSGCVMAAAYYVYVTLHGRSMSIHSNTCFDGAGEAIPFERIEYVEFVESA